MPQPQTDQPMAPQEKDTKHRHPQDSHNTNEIKQPTLSSKQDNCKTLKDTKHYITNKDQRQNPTNIRGWLKYI